MAKLEGDQVDEVDAFLDAEWSRLVTPKLGFPNYAALNAELGQQQRSKLD